MTAARLFIAGYCWEDGEPYVIAAVGPEEHAGGYCTDRCRQRAKSRGKKRRRRAARRMPCPECSEAPDRAPCPKCWKLLERMCRGKERRPRSAAEATAEEMSAAGRVRPGSRLAVYKCPMCRWWHVGNAGDLPNLRREQAAHAAQQIPRAERARIVETWSTAPTQPQTAEEVCTP